jgi:hypothetical protein
MKMKHLIQDSITIVVLLVPIIALLMFAPEINQTIIEWKNQ